MSLRSRGCRDFPSSNTKTIQPRDGVPVTTDGPFLEAKDVLAGYLMVEVDGVERAVAIAAGWPDARMGAMEVRPVMDASGMEM